jgi:hypothetical protein
VGIAPAREVRRKKRQRAMPTLRINSTGTRMSSAGTATEARRCQPARLGNHAILTGSFAMFRARAIGLCRRNRQLPLRWATARVKGAERARI